MKKILILIFVALMLVGCSVNNANQNNEKSTKKKIVTTIYPVYEFTKLVVGDNGEVVSLVPFGSSAHDYEPTAKDIAAIEEADVFVYHGAEMEPWIDKILAGIANKKLLIINASEGIELAKATHTHHEHEHEHEHEKEHEHEHEKEHEHEHEKEHKENEHHHHHGEYDPHVWLAPLNAKAETKNIADKLIAFDSDHASKYQENFKKVAAEFDKLHQEFMSGLSNVKQKEIVVSHEAFGYLCNAYGLVQYGVEGIVPTSEPDPSKMTEIIHFVKEHNINTIFFEELASEKVAAAISKETGAKVAVLNPLETLTSEQISKGENYFSIQRQNLNSLINALVK